MAHYILVIGCGRLGALLANQLSREGHQVVVVDQHDTAFDALSIEFSGFRIIGDAGELSVLRQAKIEQADLVLATTNSDNLNLMVSQIARKIFNVPRVVARVYDPAREAIYQDFGIDTINPTQLSASAFSTVLNHNPGQNKR